MANRKIVLSPIAVAQVISKMLRQPHVAERSDRDPPSIEAEFDDNMDTVAAFAAEFADRFEADFGAAFNRNEFLIDCGLANYSRYLINLKTQQVRQII